MSEQEGPESPDGLSDSDMKRQMKSRRIAPKEIHRAIFDDEDLRRFDSLLQLTGR